MNPAQTKPSYGIIQQTLKLPAQGEIPCYHFNAGVTENTDQVTWRDDCFTRSFFLGCCYLAEVSAAAALASTPY